MEKRVVIVDYNHLAHTYFNSQHRLSKTIDVGGVKKVIDTTIQSGTIKAIHRWSNHGANPTAVCFDSPVPARKGYFAKSFDMPVDGDKAYKGGRKSMAGDVYEAIEMVKDILVDAGVSCYKGYNYEADDLIYACIKRAKQDYPNMPIDVITNDADLLPLVDNQVSVFLRSKKGTWAERKDLEKLHYIQVTPANYQGVVQDLSAYKKFLIPYNSILLHKLLRGDTSDNIEGIKKLFPPKKYNAIVEDLIDRNIDFAGLFRYGDNTRTYISISTGEEVDPHTHDRSDLAVRYGDPVELTNLIDLLCWYIEDDAVIEHIKKMYRGMNLNQAYSGLGEISRQPVVIKKPIVPFSEGLLQSKVRPLDINLKMNLY